MPDLLVRLYDLPAIPAPPPGMEIRRALPPERRLVQRWIEEHFSGGWADECAVAFARLPVSCFLAVGEERILGFVAYEATCRNFLGPIGVTAGSRGKGLGAALLLAGLHAMQAEGYAYAIIGGAGPVDFYLKTVDAKVIEHSDPGIYRGMLRSNK